MGWPSRSSTRRTPTVGSTGWSGTSPRKRSPSGPVSRRYTPMPQSPRPTPMRAGTRRSPASRAASAIHPHRSSWYRFRRASWPGSSGNHSGAAGELWVWFRLTITWEEGVPTASPIRSRRPFITARSIQPVSVATVTTFARPSDRTSAVADRSLSMAWTSPSRELKPKVRIPGGGLIRRRAAPANRSGKVMVLRSDGNYSQRQTGTCGSQTGTCGSQTGTCGNIRSFVKMVSVRQSTWLQSYHVM